MNKIFQNFNIYKLHCILFAVLFLLASCGTTNKSVYTPEQIQNVALTDKQQQEKTQLLEQAKKESLLGNLEASREAYMKALKTDPACAVCFYELSMLYYRAGYLINAQNLSKQAYMLDSTNVWYKRQLAQLTFAAGKYNEAEKLYTSLLEQDSENPDAYYSLAGVYENSRQYDKAIALYDSAQNRFGFNENVSVRQQTLYARMGKLTESIAEAQKLVEYDPENAGYYALYGDSYAQALQDSLAVVAYNQAIAIEPNYPPAVVGKAEIARKKGDFPEYFRNIKLYCQSDGADSRDKVEYLSLVLNLPSFGEHFKSNFDTLFTVLNNKYPKYVDIKYLHSGFLAQTARPDSAISIIRVLISQNKNNYNSWAQLLAMEGGLLRWNDVKTDADTAIQLFPNNHVLYMYRGMSYWQINMPNNAIDDFEKSAKLGKNDERFATQIYAYLGDLYHEVNKDKKAFEYYEKVLAVDSLNANVLNNYAYYLAVKGQNMNRAYNMSRRAVEIDSSNSSYLDTFGWILYLQGRYTEARAIFRQAMAAGGKQSAVILDHYADLLYKLGEYDMASIYWNQALEKPDCTNKEEILKKLKMIK